MLHIFFLHWECCTIYHNLRFLLQFLKNHIYYYLLSNHNLIIATNVVSVQKFQMLNKYSQQVHGHNRVKHQNPLLLGCPWKHPMYPEKIKMTNEGHGVWIGSLNNRPTRSVFCEFIQYNTVKIFALRYISRESSILCLHYLCDFISILCIILQNSDES